MCFDVPSSVIHVVNKSNKIFKKVSIIQEYFK
jgi:hypothetical protein